MDAMSEFIKRHMPDSENVRSLAYTSSDSKKMFITFFERERSYGKTAYGFKGVMRFTDLGERVSYAELPSNMVYNEIFAGLIPSTEFNDKNIVKIDDDAIKKLERIYRAMSLIEGIYFLDKKETIPK